MGRQAPADAERELVEVEVLAPHEDPAVPLEPVEAVLQAEVEDRINEETDPRPGSQSQIGLAAERLLADVEKPDAGRPVAATSPLRPGLGLAGTRPAWAH